jgi:N-acetylmuramoyl-L-alanine amidase
MKPAAVLTRSLVCAIVAMSPVAFAQESAGSEEKKGWFDRVKSAVGLAKKEEPPPAPPPAPEPPKTTKPKTTSASPSSSSKKKTATTAQQSKTSITKPKTTATAAAVKKSEPKPEPPKPTSPTPVVGPKPEEAKVATAPSASPAVKSTPAPEPAPKAPAAAAPMSRNLDSEFATLNEEPPPAPPPVKPAEPKTPVVTPPPAKTAEAPKTPSPSLPSNVGAAWQILEYGGQDYVTAESMHRFYRFSEFKVTGDHVWFKNPTLIMKGRVGSSDMLINNIKFVLSNPARRIGGKVCFSRLDLAKLLDPVIRPWLITQGEPFDTVILDPGHGGHDSGAKGMYGYEKDFALKLGEATRAALLKRGFKVVMTRQDDRFISLGSRVKFANAIPKSIFISLHFNSASTSASGIETFALTPQGGSSTSMGARAWDAKAFTGNVRDAENIALATAVHAMVMHRFKLIDRGIKRARWSVLTGCTRPGILFEGGFVTNQTEGRLIASQLYREQLANAIADAIMNYRAALHPRTAQQR